VRFPFNVYLLAFGGGCLATLLALPGWRAWCRRTGLVDEPGQRKIHALPIPLAGGLAVFTGLCATACFGVLATWANWLSPTALLPLSHGLGRRGLQLAAIMAGALGMLVLGWLDDKHELAAAPKFGGQLLVALLVAASGVRITLFVHSVLFSYLITLLWILTVTNAFNFTDNMNGLCAGLGALGAFFFALKAAVDGQYLVALFAFLVCGALLGFLPYNFPRATAFLGDAGSHLAGYLLAVLAILPHFYSPDRQSVLAVLSPLLILAVPLGDLVWVVLLRWRLGRLVYVGDTNHLSHRLVRRGLSPTRAVLFIWLLAACCGSLSLWLW
jgi:UDP-GlcNAc:undecaprenyl-phosphate GlcNAc-1-phosphate transferase